jgi:two-component system nitrate/nitrite response regulator NarL
MPSVLIADDHPAYRAGVRAVLEAEGYTVVAEVGDRRSAIQAAIRQRPDICVVDLDMPGGGLNAVRGIVQKLPETQVVVLTVSTSSEDLVGAVQAGAAGLLVKGSDRTALPKALRAALNGEAVLPRKLVRPLLQRLVSAQGRSLTLPDNKRTLRLTDREWSIAAMLRNGRSTLQMAESLQISPVTVRRHVSELTRKLGVRDRREAAELLGRTLDAP